MFVMVKKINIKLNFMYLLSKICKLTFFSEPCNSCVYKFIRPLHGVKKSSDSYEKLSFLNSDHYW